MSKLFDERIAEFEVGLLEWCTLCVSKFHCLYKWCIVRCNNIVDCGLLSMMEVVDMVYIVGFGRFRIVHVGSQCRKCFLYGGFDIMTSGKRVNECFKDVVFSVEHISVGTELSDIVAALLRYSICCVGLQNIMLDECFYRRVGFSLLFWS